MKLSEIIDLSNYPNFTKQQRSCHVNLTISINNCCVGTSRCDLFGNSFKSSNGGWCIRSLIRSNSQLSVLVATPWVYKSCSFLTHRTVLLFVLLLQKKLAIFIH